MQELLRKIMAGEIPVTSQVRSESKEPFTIQVGNVVVTQGGVKRVLSEELLTLSTNQIPGDKTQRSMASISLPTDGSIGTISTVGNASVGNGAPPLNLRLLGDAKKLKASSPTGGFAVALLRLQHDTQLEYFDLLFGTKGKPEVVDEAGRKNRSHLALYPDGNGKFLRLECDGCEIISDQTYSAVAKSIVPRQLRIRSPEFPETLVAEFNASNTTVELVSIAFE